jgi:hypothetical protein
MAANNPQGPSPTTSRRPTAPQVDIKKRRNRREYALPQFDFESNTAENQRNSSDVLAAYGLVRDDKADMNADHQKRAERYYGDQILVPNGSVSPCLNATDRARRARHSRIRERDSATHSPPVVDTGTFCDITPQLLEPRKSKSVATASKDTEEVWTDDEVLDERDIPDMELTDEEHLVREFEMVKYEPGSEHNGTVRRWYRGFRH